MAQLDFTRQQRIQLNVYLHPDDGKIPEEQHEWIDLASDAREPAKFALALPLTNVELSQAMYDDLCCSAEGPWPTDMDRLSYRYKKSGPFEKTPLFACPETELALQAMLACSLFTEEVHGTQLYELQDLVWSYWKEVHSIFPRCVDEISLSSCRAMLDFLEWTESTADLMPIYLIPTGDVNHKRSRFYAYPRVWDVFATIFGQEYHGLPSFYYENPNPKPARVTTLHPVSGAGSSTSSKVDKRDVPYWDSTESENDLVF